MAKAKKFELFVGDLGGGGLTCSNMAVQEHGDYKRVAYITNKGKIEWYVADDYCPQDAKTKIKEFAARKKEEYQTWFNGLTKDQQHMIKLDEMTTREFIEYCKAQQRKDG